MLTTIEEFSAKNPKLATAAKILLRRNGIKPVASTFYDSDTLFLACRTVAIETEMESRDLHVSSCQSERAEAYQAAAKRLGI